jgi:DNA polymerase III epsilon subunit-like protein
MEGSIVKALLLIVGVLIVIGLVVKYFWWLLGISVIAGLGYAVWRQTNKPNQSKPRSTARPITLTTTPPPQGQRPRQAQPRAVRPPDATTSGRSAPLSAAPPRQTRPPQRPTPAPRPTTTPRVIQRSLLTRAITNNIAAGQVFTAVDLETTGLYPLTHRIVEIGLVKFRGDGEILDEFATLVNNPGSSPEARMRHQIDDEDLIGSPTIDHVLPEVFAFMAGTVVVAHNLDFEEGFLLLAAQRNRLSLPRLTGVCTVQAARRQLDGRAYSLLSLYKTATGEWPHDKHTALGDARAVRKVLLWMLRTAPQPMHLTLGAIPVPATAVAVQPCAISCRPMPMTRASVAALLESFPQSPTHGAATRPRLTVTGVYSTNAFTTDDSPLRRPPHCPAKPGAPA